MHTLKLSTVLAAIVLVGATFPFGPGFPIDAEAVAVTEWLDCRPTADQFNPGFPICDLQTGIALNNLVSAPPAGPLVVLEPDTFEHTSTWESAPSTTPITLLPGPVTLNLLHVNLSENIGTDDICWSKHAILPDGSEIVIVAQHCFENPLPVAGFICPFGAVAPAIPAACIAAAGVASETVPSLIVAPLVLPVGTVIELNISCPGASFLAVFFNNGIDVDGDGVLEFTTITEQVNQPPDCTNAAPSEALLWPPNHKFVDISISGVTDPDGDTVTITVTGITQDEELNAKGKGDGNTSPDGSGVGTDTAQVRAERAGTGDGRVYEISFTADDGNGGTCIGTVQVGVPHDQKKPVTAVDSGQTVDSTGP